MSEESRVTVFVLLLLLFPLSYWLDCQAFGVAHIGLAVVALCALQAFRILLLRRPLLPNSYADELDGFHGIHCCDGIDCFDGFDGVDGVDGSDGIDCFDSFDCLHCFENIDVYDCYHQFDWKRQNAKTPWRSRQSKHREVAVVCWGVGTYLTRLVGWGSLSE